MAGSGKPTRASEMDRLDTIARLDYAYADGQLQLAEHTERVARAQHAQTLDDLTPLTEDLKSAPAVMPRPARRPKRLYLAGAAVAAVVALGGVGVVAINHDSSEPTVGQHQFTHPDMLTEDAIEQLFDAVSARFGTTVVPGVHLYDNSAEVQVFDAEAPNGTMRYSYTPGGQLHSPQAYGGQSVSGDPNAPPVDLESVNVAAIVEYVDKSADLLGVTPDEPGFRVTIGGNEIWLGVNDISKDSHLVMALDGTILSEEPCGWGC